MALHTQLAHERACKPRAPCGTTALAASPFAGYAIVAAIASGYTIRRVYRQCAGCAHSGAEQRHDGSDGCT